MKVLILEDDGQEVKRIPQFKERFSELNKKLEEIGWIKYRTLKDHKVCTYIFGYWTEDQSQRKEVYYADECLEKLDALLALKVPEFRLQLPLIPRGIETDSEAKLDKEFGYIREIIQEFLNSVSNDIAKETYLKKPVSFLNTVKKCDQKGAASVPIEALSCDLERSDADPKEDQDLVPESYTEQIRSETNNKEQKNVTDNIKILRVLNGDEDRTGIDLTDHILSFTLVSGDGGINTEPFNNKESSPLNPLS